MNNKKMNKKGFTIVELVIVIAVIAILAGVMIPTFGGIIDRANESGAMQTAAALYKEAYALDLSDGDLDGMKDGADVTCTVKTGEKAIYDYISADDKATFAFTDGKYWAKFDGADWTSGKNSALPENDPLLA